MKSRRVLGYARVSSAEQALGTSLHDQQASIEAYAKSRGLKVSRMYVEAVSAVHEKFERREQIQALMRDVREGDLVVCDKLDRWSRDPEFTWRSVRELHELRASVYFVSEQCDPSTPQGDTLLNFRIAFAREEHKRIKERMVGTRNLLRSRGYYVEGTPPYGYRRALPHGSKGLEKNILVIDPEPAERVRQMFRMVIAGRSLQQIAGELGLGRKRVWSSIHCRTYIGEVRTKDGWIKGHHEPIVDAALFAEANEIFSARRHGGHRPRSAPSRTDTWILRDVAHCALCGARMRAAYGNNRETDHYYACAKKCRSLGPRVTTGTHVRVSEVESLFSAMVVVRLSELREEIAKGSEPSAPRTTDVAARRLRLQQKRQRYLDQHAEGLASLSDLRASLAKVDAELLKLNAEEARRPARLSAPARREMLRELANLELAWTRATPAMKRQLVNLLVERVDLAKGAPVAPVWRSKEMIAKAVR